MRNAEIGGCISFREKGTKGHVPTNTKYQKISPISGLLWEAIPKKIALVLSDNVDFKFTCAIKIMIREQKRKKRKTSCQNIYL